MLKQRDRRSLIESEALMTDDPYVLATKDHISLYAEAALLRFASSRKELLKIIFLFLSLSCTASWLLGKLSGSDRRRSRPLVRAYPVMLELNLQVINIFTSHHNILRRRAGPNSNQSLQALSDARRTMAHLSQPAAVNISSCKSSRLDLRREQF